jgi:peptidoglycan/LPS O-acetylase OafA/YrhL
VTGILTARQVSPPGGPGAPWVADQSRGPRLAWLDALRGTAALWVVYEHWGARVLPALHAVVFSVFDPGLYGVMVFFLISGYIVPASLERTGSVRTFWVSRLFRLFPLFAVVIALTLALNLLGLPVLDSARKDVAASALTHLFMLNDLLGEPNLVVVIWTLSYEMVFYLLVTALFTARLHRRSGGIAVILAAGALGLGGLLPTVWLSQHTLGPTALAMAADVLVIGGLAAAVIGRSTPRAVGAWVAAATGLVLVVLNERKFGYEGLTILALMFTGTLLYRAQHGQVGRRRAAIVTAGVFVAIMAAGAWHIPALTSSSQPALQQREWIMSVALAGLSFAAGLAVQSIRVPRALAWLGLGSYSVYLVFPLLLDVYDSIPFPASYQHQTWLQVAASAIFLAALLGTAAVTYRLVEAPMQRVGRRVARRLDDRYGPDTAPTVRPDRVTRGLASLRPRAPDPDTADGAPGPRTSLAG